ncbi:cytochrome b N-terminal domain-containing protein, partial [bacterium]|nr:cytochrome b N-terminal domain-containing protein [bacterium]
MISVGTALSAISQFIGERFPVDKLNFHSMVEKKEVPIHRMSWGYYTGGLTMFFFMMQVITGLFLLFYYQPTVSDANVSVEYINKYVAGGALIRNMHAWSSSFMILFAMVHLLTAFAMKSFVKPREITWIAGVLLLFITFTFGFTGYLLPWNQIAVNATKVGLQSVEYVGQYLPGQL